MSEQARDHMQNPLDRLEDWDDFVESRYPEETETPEHRAKTHDEYRDYRNTARDCVREFYRLNHRFQTFDFVRQKEKQYLSLNKCKMGIWEAIEQLNTLIDDSDPDIELSQLDHLLQTSEAIRHDGHPRWFILTGLLHDLGKILCLWGEPQWAVVGDTFPVGCKYSDKIVFPEFFNDNPDIKVPEYQTLLGVYEEECGLDQVHLSWGHDEYLYHVVKDYLPEPALYMIRYHSFYPAHREGEYDYLMNDHDREMFYWVREFNQYDLYSKVPVPPDLKQLMPYYKDLVAEFFPDEIRW
ncbi:MAG: inositol oxygenase family protein [bacterium]